VALVEALSPEPELVVEPERVVEPVETIVNQSIVK
jgi:hypothetical protein